MQVRFHRNIAASSLAADCNVPQRPPAIIRSFTSIQMAHTHTTLSHTHTTSSHTHNFVQHNIATQDCHTHTHTQLSHTQLCHTQLCHTHTTLSHITLSHQLCHTHNLLTHNFVTHSPFVHNFVTHNIVTHTHRQLAHTHTSLSHTICHTQLRHTQHCHTQHCHTPSTCVLPGRRGTYGTGLHLVARLVPVGRPGRRSTLRGRRGTWRQPLAFRVAGVALMDIHVPFAWQAWRLWRWAGSGGVSCVGRERDGSDDRVDGRETVRNR